jgi:hypothetical protein
MALTTTKLDAVNTILSNIGQSPVVDLTSGNPIVEMAEITLDEISRTVQSEGWIFNTEYDYPFNMDANNEVAIPVNVLQCDLPVGSGCSTSRRDGKLYNRSEHTYDLSNYASDGVVKCDVVWIFEFMDLPEAIKNYIIIRAANVFAGRAVGSTEAVKFGQQEETLARAGAIEYETQQGDYSIFGDTRAINTYRSYRPRSTVYRY